MINHCELFIFASMDIKNHQIDPNGYSEAFSVVNFGNETNRDGLYYKLIYISPERNVLAITMGENVEFESFQVDKEVIIEVIKGRILLKVNNTRYEMTDNSCYNLSSKKYYLIEAFENTSLLLTTIT